MQRPKTLTSEAKKEAMLKMTSLASDTERIAGLGGTQTGQLKLFGSSREVKTQVSQIQSSISSKSRQKSLARAAPIKNCG